MLIAIDAGHGPETAGKRSPDGTLREYQFNSAVADEMEKILKLNKVRVLRTDDKSTDVSLRDRCKKANDAKCGYFVSIHANASGNTWSNANGIETFIKGNNTDKLEYKKSFDMATRIHKSLITLTKAKNRGVKTSNDLYVLNATSMPALLVECGFMTNKTENEKLKSTQYRLLCAQAIAQPIIDLFAPKIEKK
jgi:N-acetylmuramoyl-L-alanine amidase